MTDQQQLHDLIAKLEAATKPDRELDLAITNIETEQPPWEWLDRSQETVICNRYGKGAPGNSVASLERFTASADDAMIAIPGDWRVHCIAQHYGKWSVCLHRAFGAEEDEVVWKRGHHWPAEYNAKGEHRELAIAIVLAALKIRACGERAASTSTKEG